MSSELIRDRALRNLAIYLTEEGIPPSKAAAVALGVERVLEALGVRLPRRPRIEDPNALALAPKPPPAPPDVAQAAIAALRASVRPTAAPDDRAERPPLDHLPPLPGEPE